MKRFKTISQEVEIEIVEKKSKFIANFFYIENVEEAENMIKKIKRKYYDAKHNCIAYRVIEGEKIIEKASDDGEPLGTAGGPMLNILQKKDLANVLVIVTRYFGGILLGTGGLVRAYSDCLQEAIKKSKIVEKSLGYEIQIVLDYADFDKFQYYCKKREIEIVEIKYLEDIICIIQIEEEKNEQFLKEIENKSLSLKKLKELSKKYIDKSK